MSVRGLALALPLALGMAGALPECARADGESALDAGSGRQQALLEHQQRELASLRERVAELDAAAARAAARAATLEDELAERSRRLETAGARDAALEGEVAEQRRRAEASEERVAALEGELAEQGRRLDGAARDRDAGERRLEELRAELAALESAREDTRTTLRRHAIDEDALGDELDALAALRASEAARQARLDAALGERERTLATLRAYALDEASLADGLDALVASRDAARTAERANAARIAELESALAGARTRLARSDDSIDAPRADGGAPATAAAPAPVPASTAVSVTAVSDDELVLSPRWYVPLESGVPRGYTGHAELEASAELPPADACDAFADGATADPAALSKLEVNGFPVTAFWVRRDDGRAGVCRLTARASGGFEARLSTLAVMRSERAIVATRRGGRE